MDRIFIVEDDDNIRKLVCYALNKEGFSVSGFALPSEFRKAFAEEKPDIILLDIMLPEESGLSILESLRKTDETVPIIMLTAKGSEFDKVTGLDMGADDYISKPFRWNTALGYCLLILINTPYMLTAVKSRFLSKNLPFLHFC